MNYDAGNWITDYLGAGMLAVSLAALVFLLYLAWSKLMASLSDLTAAADGITAAAAGLTTAVNALIAKPAPTATIPDALVTQINDATASVNATAAAATTAAAAP